MTKTPPTNRELYVLILRHINRQAKRIRQILQVYGDDQMLAEMLDENGEAALALGTLVQNANGTQGVINGGIVPKEKKQREQQTQLQLA